MRLIGITAALSIIIYIVSAVSNHDWDLLKEILRWTGAFIVAAGILLGLAWLLVKLLDRKPSVNKTKSKT